MTTIKYILLSISLLCGIVISSCVVNFTRQATNAMQDEFGPKQSLIKYEWFKDAAAQLVKKQADIKIYNDRLNSLIQSYNEEPRKNWNKDDREQYNIWTSELAGIKASYNSLAADYNAQMAKFNWRFANTDNEKLPKEFKEYLGN